MWRGPSYADLAFAVLSKFVDDIPAEDLKKLVDRPTPRKSYCNGAIRAARARSHRYAGFEPGFRAAELSNGPTPLTWNTQLLGKFVRVCWRGGRRSTSLCHPVIPVRLAEYAMRGKRGVRVFMLSP